MLLGILLMPFLSVMRYLADLYHNPALDPSTWTTSMYNLYSRVCKEHPAVFVLSDFAAFAFFVLLILFHSDLSKWWATRHLRAQGYGELQEDAASTAESKFGALAKVRKRAPSARAHGGSRGSCRHLHHHHHHHHLLLLLLEPLLPLLLIPSPPFPHPLTPLCLDR